MKKLPNKKEVKDVIHDYVRYYLKDTTRIIEFVDALVGACNENGNPINERVAEVIPQFLKCRLLDIEHPELRDEAGWAQIDKIFIKFFGNFFFV